VERSGRVQEAGWGLRAFGWWDQWAVHTHCTQYPSSLCPSCLLKRDRDTRRSIFTSALALNNDLDNGSRFMGYSLTALISGTHLRQDNPRLESLPLLLQGLQLAL